MHDPARDVTPSPTEPPPPRQADLYDHPEVYSALRAPAADLLEGVRALLAEHLGASLRPRRHHGRPSLMDPACGPANWLEPFAREGWFVAGNDLSREMVAGARRALGRLGAPHEIVQGDMRALAFATGPFDAAFEIAGSTGLLPRAEDLRAHLESVAAHLRPRGVFLVTIFFDERDRAGDLDLPRLFHLSDPVPVQRPDGGEGTARARYELIGWDDDPPAARMRRTVLTRGVPGCPTRIVEEYGLRVWHEAEVLALIEATGCFDVVCFDGLPEPGGNDPLGEHTLVLRRRG